MADSYAGVYKSDFSGVDRNFPGNVGKVVVLSKIASHKKAGDLSGARTPVIMSYDTAKSI
jgi:hypothetical protein